MALWMKKEDGTLVDVSGGSGGDAEFTHDHDYLPLTGGTLTGDLEVDGTVATINPGSEGAPAYTSTLYPTTGMYGHADGVFFAVDGHWTFGSWADRVGIRNNLQVDGSATVGGKAVSVSGHTHSYSPTNHTHSEYAPTHSHPYAATSHTHSYSPTDHTHSYSPTNHNHNNQTHSAAYGTAASPGFRFHSDSNTGMYRYASDAIGFAAGGKNRARVSTSGTEIVGPNRGDSNKTWADLQLRVMSENDSGNDSSNSHVGIAIWAQRPGLAPMMRVHKPGGEGIGFTNSANSAFIDVFAKGVVIPSASMTKRNIKTVQDDAVISLAEKWLMAEFDRQVGPKSVRLKPEAAVRQAAILDAGEELPPADVADYDSVDHDCALDLCSGTPENPCPIIVNHRSEWGGIAEWWGEVAPQQVVFDEEGNATGIKLEQVAATALGAVGGLSRRLSSSLDRIDALEARIEELEGN